MNLKNVLYVVLLAPLLVNLEKHAAKPTNVVHLLAPLLVNLGKHAADPTNVVHLLATLLVNLGKNAAEPTNVVQQHHHHLLLLNANVILTIHAAEAKYVVRQDTNAAETNV